MPVTGRESERDRHIHDNLKRKHCHQAAREKLPQKIVGDTRNRHSGQHNQNQAKQNEPGADESCLLRNNRVDEVGIIAGKDLKLFWLPWKSPCPNSPP